MKNTVFLCGLLFILSACMRKADDISFSGNWYTCQKDGYYLELHIQENSFRFCPVETIDMQVYPFWLSGDTLVYQDNYLFEDSTKIYHTAIISFLKGNQMQLFYPETDETWIFESIEEKIQDYPDSQTVDSKVLLKYEEIRLSARKRATKASCPDLRTSEEKVADSLNRVIDFQF